jgi:hypothetical protein
LAGSVKASPPAPKVNVVNIAIAAKTALVILIGRFS